MDPVRLETARTVVRTPEPGDAQRLHAFVTVNRDRLAPWEPERSETYFQIESCAERLAAWADEQRRASAIRFFATDPAGDRILATCAYSNIVHGAFQACHLGYAVDGGEEGRGIMREVLQATIPFMFDTIGLHRIMANYMPGNVRSERLLMSLGFQREGLAHAYLKIAGRWEDHVLTALIHP